MMRALLLAGFLPALLSTTACTYSEPYSEDDCINCASGFTCVSEVDGSLCQGCRDDSLDDSGTVCLDANWDGCYNDAGDLCVPRWD